MKCSDAVILKSQQTCHYSYHWGGRHSTEGTMAAHGTREAVLALWTLGHHGAITAAVESSRTIGRTSGTSGSGYTLVLLQFFSFQFTR